MADDIIATANTLIQKYKKHIDDGKILVKAGKMSQETFIKEVEEMKILWLEITQDINLPGFPSFDFDVYLAGK